MALTFATAAFELAHVTVRPASALPFASFGVAVSCSVAPTVTVADAGLTVTDATGTWTTVTVADPLFPSLVAVIVTVPATLPVTRPLPFTVATAVLLDAHDTVRPDRALPVASRGVAVSCTVCPSLTEAVAGVTSTVATGTLAAVMAAVPLWPSLVAVIVAEPAATPETRPVALTFATAVLLLDQDTVRPDNGLPFASLGVAVNCTVPPTGTLAVAGLTLTEATGTGGTAPLTVALQTVCVPASEYSTQSASDVAVFCSVRKAKPVPIVCSVPPAGVTYAA